MAGRKPRFGGGVGREEGEELVGDFLAAGIGGVRAVIAKVGAEIGEVICVAASFAVRPKIGSPEQQRSFPGGVVESRSTVDLVLNKPADGKGAFVGVRLGVQLGRGVAGV